jgi:hypothetical protein
MQTEGELWRKGRVSIGWKKQESRHLVVLSLNANRKEVNAPFDKPS